MSTFFRREPVAVITLIITVIEAGLALGMAFGLSLSSEQLGAITAFVVAIGNLTATLVARAQVTPLSDPRDNNGNPLRADGSQPVRPIGATVVAT